jgi:hypothetical protein
MGAAEQRRRATAHYLDNVAEQRGPFFRGHGRKLAVGSPDQEAIEIHPQKPLDALGKPMNVDAAIGHEWRDCNIEKSFEPGLGFARRHRSQRLQPPDAVRSARLQNPSNAVAKCLKTTPSSDFQAES